MDKRTLRSKKGRPRNARQYDRPNQGIFGKVCSTVRGILQPTSWIFNSVSNWISNSEEMQPGTCTDMEEETVREDNDVVSHAVSHGNKRLRLRFDDNIPSIQSSGTQTWPDQPPQNLYDTVSCVQSPTTQSSLLENKESIAVLNGDDHSENSEESASTSGCSSLVSSHKDSSRLVASPFHSLRSEIKNNRKRKEPSSKSGLDDLNTSRTLWSSGFSPSSKFQRRLPTISHTNQPSFNLSAFGGPSKLNESMEKKISSPFYEGRTAFGGASASRRMPSSVAPYQVDKTLRNQIKVRVHNSEDNLEGMSSAAKRILLTLEKMSTPVADAKKIPNTKTSPVDLSVYLTPPKSRRNSQFTPTISSKGPPIANINTIAKLATLKNYGVSRLRNTLPSNPVISAEQEGYSFDILQSSSSSETVVQKSGGGKMKNKLNQHHHSSKDANREDEVLEAPNLPNIPLPISKLPTINFGTKAEKLVDSNHSAKGFTFSSPIEHDLKINNSISSTSYTLPSSFDSKIEKNSDLQPKSFVFSSPIEHELPNNNVLLKENTPLPDPCTAKPGVPSRSTWECSACWVQNPISGTSCMACETPKVLKENHSSFKFKFTPEESKSNPVVSTSASISSTSAFSFTNSTSSPVFTFVASKPNQSVTPHSLSFCSSDSNAKMWECASCWVKNSEKESKCVACETVRPMKDNLNSRVVDPSSISSTSSTWECSACWVKNPIKESKCLSCETPRSLKESNKGFGCSSVVSTPVEWECNSCWVKNPMKESKCMACDTVRSSKDNSGIKSTASSVFSTWECTSCWVRNPMKEKKCMACETLHPNADETAGLKDTNGFKFNSPIQNSPITFKFGNYVCTAPSTATTSSFKFGTAASEPQITTNSTGFKFVIPSSASTSSFFSSAVLAPDGTQIGKDIVNESSTKIVKDAVSEGSTLTAKDAVNESSKMKANDSVNEGFAETGKNTVKTAKTPEQSGVNSEFTNPMPVIVNKNSENKVSNSVITSTSSETLVSVAKEVVAPSVTACFSFTTQPLLDSKKTETFPFGAPKEKLSLQSLPSPFSVFHTPSTNKDKSSELKKPMQSETKNTNASTENKLSSFQLTSESQQVSSPFTVLSNAPVFKFGEKTDSSKNNVSSASVTLTTATTTSFCFTNNTSNLGSVSDPKVSEICSVTSQTVPPPPSVKAEDSKIPSSVTFPSTTTTTSSFVFGNTVTTSAPSTFSFFPSSTTTSSTASSVFTFGVSSNTAQTSKPGGFTFKGLEKPQNITSVSSITPVSSTSQSTTPVLNAGTPAAVPGGFVFGTPKTEAQSTGTAPFAFGTGAVSSSNTSAFSAFQPSQSANTAFQFGSQPIGSTASTIGTSSSFAFTKSEMSNQVPSSVSQNPVSAFGSSKRKFVFGTKNETPNQIPSTVSQAPGLGFGSSASSFTFSNKTENTNTVSQNPNPTFGSSVPSVFGNTSVTPFGGADKPVSGGFNFGGVSTSGIFQFGTSNNTERKRSATASGFSFGTPAASEPNSSFQPNFNMSTPPSFNFGATSTPAGPGPFQFAASSAPKSTATQSAPRKYRKALRRVRKD